MYHSYYSNRYRCWQMGMNTCVEGSAICVLGVGTVAHRQDNHLVRHQLLGLRPVCQVYMVQRLGLAE